MITDNSNDLAPLAGVGFSGGGITRPIKQLTDNFPFEVRSLKGGFGNTRLNSQSAGQSVTRHLDTAGLLKIGLDYLRIVYHFEDKSQINDFLDYICNGEPWTIDYRPWSAGRGAKSYQFAIDTVGRGSGGILFHEEDDIKYNDGVSAFVAGSGEIMFDFTGEVFHNLTLFEQFQLIYNLRFCYNCRCTRIDICLDDFSKDKIPLDSMIESFKNDLQVGFQNYDLRHSMRWTWFDDNGQKIKKLVSTPTHYFGSRESGKVVRIYNHLFLNDSSLRYEVEFKKKRAEVLFYDLAKLDLDNKNPDAAFARILSQYITGSLSFIEYRKDKNIKRCPVASYWQKFRDIVSAGISLKIKLPPEYRTFNKSARWLRRSVSKTLASLIVGAGKELELIEYLREVAKKSLSKYHEMLYVIAEKKPSRLKAFFDFDKFTNSQDFIKVK